MQKTGYIAQEESVMKRYALALGIILALAPTPLNASITPSIHSHSAEITLTAQEKQAYLEPYMNSTTLCVAQAMQRDPRKNELNPNDLLVAVFEQCIEPVEALVKEHDRQYGPDSGRVFFQGPYLDALPYLVKEKAFE